MSAKIQTDSPLIWRERTVFCSFTAGGVFERVWFGDVEIGTE
jgi:hypothetical protein